MLGSTPAVTGARRLRALIGHTDAGQGRELEPAAGSWAAGSAK